jgi:hypothetical protein
MTREQHQSLRELERVEAGVLRAYHWTQDVCGNWTHAKAPTIRTSYTQRDALAMTRAETLRYGSRP